MMCVGHNDIESYVYKKFVEKNKCIRTNGMLDVGIYTKLFNLM